MLPRMRSRRIFRWLPILRFSAALAVAAPVLPACSDSGDGKEAPTATDGASSMEPPAGETRRQSAVQLKLDDGDELLTGGAQLQVRELNPVVNLVVTTTFEFNHDDLLEFKLAFEGVENTVGSHSSEFTSASNSAASAVAYLERISYLSQSGTLDVTLTGDGAIHGRFDAELAPDAAGSSDPAGVPASAKNFNVTGTFDGTWSLVCRSPVIGLPGDHSVADSPYCRSLAF